MTTARQYFSNINKPFLLIKWKVKAESHLFLSTTLLTYVLKNPKDADDSDEQLKLKSTVEGTILELLVKEGEVVQPGSPLLMVQSCTHELIMKEICAHCGADLFKSGLLVNFPEIDLQVTKEQAKQLEKAGERQLLRKRKLALLICVDKTLIDTIDIQDKLELSESCCTKVRPGTRNFLKAISPFYELHFFTNGNNSYANKIAEILDPVGDLFCGRVWTKEKCFNPGSSAGYLKAIFPHGDSMVCIVDREEGDFKDVTSNVIYVKPFSFLSNSLSNFISDDDLVEKHDMPSSLMAQVPEEVVLVEHLKDNESHCSANAITSCHTGTPICDMATMQDVDSRSKIVEKDKAPVDDRPEPAHNENLVNRKENEDENTIVLCLGTLLVNIHKAYYEMYDQMVKQKMYIIHQKAIPDLKNVIPYFRHNILKGVNIVFTGVFPTDDDGDSNPLCILAKSLGARVSKDLILHDKLKGTTHIIAGKLGTNKANHAKCFKHVFVISPEWLLKCSASWDRVDEKQFCLRKEAPVSPEPPPATEPVNEETILHNVSQQKRKSQSNDDKEGIAFSPNKYQKCELESGGVAKAADTENCLTVALNLSREELKDMSSEVNEECTSEDSEDDDNNDFSADRRWNSIGAHNPKPVTLECDTIYSFATLESMLRRNGCSENAFVPYWERPCDNDVEEEYSESESLFDYIYSEDEDNLIE